MLLHFNKEDRMIALENIEIKYGDFTAVKDVSLNIKEGEFFTLLGPSGCGKTTILRALAGFIKLSSGDIKINGKSIAQLDVSEREIGMVFQSYALFPTMTVFENISFGLNVKKTDKETIKENVLDIIKKVNLSEEHLYKKVTELSGGQQQRVAIARALIMKPKILVLDEPLSNLDAKLRIQLREELKNLQHEFGITMIYVTHDQEEALSISDRVAVFNEGELMQVGTPQEVYNHSKNSFVCNFIGEVNDVTELYDDLSHTYSNDLLEVKYVRLERIHLGKKIDRIDTFNFKAKILHIQFYGPFMRIKLINENNHVIESIVKYGHDISYEVGETVDVSIFYEDVLSYA